MLLAFLLAVSADFKAFSLAFSRVLAALLAAVAAALAALSSFALEAGFLGAADFDLGTGAISKSESSASSE